MLLNKRFFLKLLMFGVCAFTFAIPASADTTINTNITTNTTWTTASSTYIIDGAITVNSGVTLTINPGVVVKFKTTSSALNISGKLNAAGTTASPIYFTSYKDDTVGGDTNGTTTTPAGGDWLYISPGFGSYATLTNAVIRYGGNNTGLGAIYDYYANNLVIASSTVATSSGYGIYSTVGSMNIATTTFTGNSNAAARVDLSSGNAFIHNGNAASGNGTNGFIVLGGMAANAYFGAGVPTVISSSNLTVASGKTLTLPPGAVVKFDSGAVMYVYGTLTVSGTSAQHVSFTSLKDDTIGGDTNNDGAATSPALGDWDRISCYTCTSATLDYATFRYGGSNSVISTLHNSGGTMTLTNSDISYSKYRALESDSGTLTMSSTTLIYNPYGFYHGGGTSNIGNRGNLIASSSSYGVYNNTGTSLNAENIYWPATTTATSTGPYHSTTHTSGNGARVSDNVDYTPWVSWVNGNVATNTTWTASSTYIIYGAITINAGVTLVISDATVVKFKDTSSRLIISGTLNASSAGSSTKIYFTSYKDDTVGGDANGDSSATSPAAGDWDGVRVGVTGSATLNTVELRYSGYTGGNSKTLWNIGGILNGYNITIATGTTYGIHNAAGTTTIIASDIHGFTNGLYKDGGDLYVGSSYIHGNSSYGVYNNTTNWMGAKYNYWGASDGPHYILGGYFGSGDNISSHVSADPWLSQLRYLNTFGTDIISAVHNKTITYIATSTKYMYALWGGVSAWNVYGTSVGGVSIATSTTASTSDLWVYDVDEGSAAGLGGYNPRRYNDSTHTTNDVITLNDYFMQQFGSSTQQATLTHELGHALGLWHSYINNIMLSYGTSSAQTSLGVQDKSDYDYCWIGATPNCKFY